jgi:LPS export ABC transporter protein LptC
VPQAVRALRLAAGPDRASRRHSAGRTRRLTLLLALLAAALFATGCSLDYESSRLADERPEGVPESVISDASFTAVREGQRQFTINAAQAETYPERNLRLFNDVSFRELDEEGELLTTGTADTVRYFTESDNVELEGAVSFYSSAHEAGIETDYLFWNDEERTLEAKPENLVRVERDSGTVVEGRGFSADLRRAVVRFEDGVEGTVVTEDEDDESDGGEDDGGEDEGGEDKGQASRPAAETESRQASAADPEAESGTNSESTDRAGGRDET